MRAPTRHDEGATVPVRYPEKRVERPGVAASADSSAGVVACTSWPPSISIARGYSFSRTGRLRVHRG